MKDNYNGFLINPDDPAELSDSINKALTKKWNKSELIASVKKFSLANMTDEVAAFIKDICNHHDN